MQYFVSQSIVGEGPEKYDVRMAPWNTVGGSSLDAAISEAIHLPLAGLWCAPSQGRVDCFLAARWNARLRALECSPQ